MRYEIRRTTLIGICFLLWPCLSASQVSANQSSPFDTVRVSLTVSGGVSLGSYQAGATWAFIFALRNQKLLDSLRQSVHQGVPPIARPPHSYTLDVLTGASAGNVNAILAAAEYCADDSALKAKDTSFWKPKTSPFWRAWIPIGVDELMPKEDSSLAVFSREKFGSLWEMLDNALARPHRADCDLLLGITATKLTPDQIRVANGVEAPVQRFAAIFRITSGGKSLIFVDPKISNVVSPGLHDVIILDPSQEGDSITRLKGADVQIKTSTVHSFVEASSSFPVAFAPKVVKYQLLDSLFWQEDPVSNPPCRLRYTETTERCAPAREARFVDGGIFDNRPLGLAFEMSRALDRAALDTTQASASRRAREALEADAKRACDNTMSLTAPDQPGRSLIELREQLQAWDDSIALLSNDSLRADSVRTLRTLQSDLKKKLDQETTILIGRYGDLSAAFRQQADCISSTQRAALARNSLQDFAQRKLPNRFLYYIDDDARRTDLTETATDKLEPRGGLAAAIGVMLDAFQTGQNNEVRAFEKELADQDKTHEESTLKVNSRYPRLMGEHLDHFGAFLSRMFREHDFYAGVYDGLRSSFKELYCEDKGQSPQSDSSRRRNAGTVNCEVAWMRLVLDHKLIDVDSQGAAVLEKLLENENGGRLRPVVANDLTFKYPLVALVQANIAARRKNAPVCQTRALVVESPLCSEQLLTVLEEWKALLTRSAEKRPAIVCKAPEADAGACDLLDDGSAVYHRFLLDVFKRTRNVEERLDRQNEAGYPSLLGLPLFLERAYDEQFRGCLQTVQVHLRCWDLNPTTSDVLEGWWYSWVARALPVTFMAKPKGRDSWLEWRPTAYVGRVGQFSFAASTPVDARQRNGDTRGYVGGQLTIIPSRTIVSSVAFSYFPNELSFSRKDGRVRSSNDLTLSFAAGLIRVGFRDDGRLDRKFLTYQHLTVGIGDLNGVSARFLGLVGGQAWHILRKPFVSEPCQLVACTP